MVREKNEIPPPPRLHKYDAKRQRWGTTWRDDQGGRHFKGFGFDTDTSERQAHRRYQHWLDTQYKAKPQVRDPKGEEARYTITMLAADYLRYARVTYVKHGRRTSHVDNVRYAMRELRDMYGPRVANDLERADLIALRDEMIWTIGQDGGRKARSMKTVNGRLHIVVQAFDRARDKGKVTKETLADLEGTKRLKRGQSEAKNPKKIKPVLESVVAETVAHMPATARALVELLNITGMRPTEACLMRTCDIETGGDVWLYRPKEHKLEHMDQERIVCLGPRAQAIIDPYLSLFRSNAYLFSPAAAQAERLEKKRAARKTKLWPSHAKKRKADPVGDRLGDHYTDETLRRAIHYACKLAGIERWNPNQLRHAVATRLRKQYGIEEASATLGHLHLSTTEIYAAASMEKAIRAAREVG